MNALPPGGGIVLAFQVWDAVGWAGQALFTLRVLVQWWSSEREGRSVVPRSFWTLSLLGSLALVVYVIHRRDPVFLAGVSINTAIYVRNLVLLRRAEPPTERQRNPWIPALLGLAAAAAVAVVLYQKGTEIVDFDQKTWVLALGFVGQAVWSSRFILQWHASEKAGRSILPPSFFLISTAGAAVLFAYAVVHDPVDWVMMAAFALNPIPYIRNLILIKRVRQAEGAGRP